jgi:hypothetical protein
VAGWWLQLLGCWITRADIEAKRGSGDDTAIPTVETAETAETRETGTPTTGPRCVLPTVSAPLRIDVADGERLLAGDLDPGHPGEEVVVFGAPAAWLSGTALLDFGDALSGPLAAVAPLPTSGSPSVFLWEAGTTGKPSHITAVGPAGAPLRAEVADAAGVVFAAEAGFAVLDGALWLGTETGLQALVAQPGGHWGEVPGGGPWVSPMPGPLAITVGDLDGDGQDEAAWLGTDQLLRLVDTVDTQRQERTNLLVNSPGDQVMGDFDAASPGVELVVSTALGAYLYDADVSGGWVQGPVLGGQFVHVAAVDWRGDGCVSLVTVTAGGLPEQVALDPDVGQWGEPAPLPAPPDLTGPVIDVVGADLDGDGAQELVVLVVASSSTGTPATPYALFVFGAAD